jgi:transcriptional regulator with XRE-family HTH domain
MLDQRLKELREAASLTQAQAAEQASGLIEGVTITEDQLRHYEAGRARPPAEKMLALSRLYRVGYSDLSLTGLPGGGR